MPKNLQIYRYDIPRPGGPPERRWTLIPVQAAGYAGNDEPKEANALGDDPSAPGPHRPAGVAEVPDGTTIASYEPPIIDIPGRGKLDLTALLDPEGGEAGELAEVVRIRRL